MVRESSRKLASQRSAARARAPPGNSLSITEKCRPKTVSNGAKLSAYPKANPQLRTRTILESSLRRGQGGFKM